MAGFELCCVHNVVDFRTRGALDAESVFPDLLEYSEWPISLESHFPGKVALHLIAIMKDECCVVAGFEVYRLV